MNIETAFTDNPPAITIDGATVQLSPLTERTQAILVQLIKKHPEDDQDNVFVGAYLIVASASSKIEAARAINDPEIKIKCEAMLMELSDEDSVAVLGYLSRVIERKQLAAVEVADTPGK
jgi:hypothetical protein